MNKKIEKVVSFTIKSIFILLMILVMFSTIVLDKKIGNDFPNTVNHMNLFYYIFASAIIFLLTIQPKKDLNNKLFICLIIAIPVLVLVAWQLPVAKWIYYYVNEGDFGSLMYAARGFNNGESFLERAYYFQSPNNANLAIVLSWVYKFCPHWRAIILLGAMLTNVSAVLIALSIRNFSENNYISIFFLIFSEILMAMTWRAFLVYTDNFGMIFVAVAVWLFSLKINEYIKMPLIILCTVMGGFIKQTVLVCLIGYLIYYIINDLQKKRSVMIISICCILFWTALLLLIMRFAQAELRSYYCLNLDGHYPKGWQYMFMVGQDSDHLGVTNSDDPKIRQELIDEAVIIGEDVNYVNKKMLDIGINRVKERHIWGNICYYVKKLNVAYNDGYFNNVQTTPPNASQELDYNVYYRLMWRENGDLYQASAGMLQILWDAVLLLLLIGSIILRNNDKFRFLSIIILGVTLYVLLFEGRSKYLYMFLPVYVGAAGYALTQFRISFNRLSRVSIFQK